MFVGKLDKIRVINNTPNVVRFTLDLPNLRINCLAVKEKIACKILMLPNGKYDLQVIGRFNNKELLVVKQIKVINPDDIIEKLGI